MQVENINFTIFKVYLVFRLKETKHVWLFSTNHRLTIRKTKLVENTFVSLIKYDIICEYYL